MIKIYAIIVLDPILNPPSEHPAGMGIDSQKPERSISQENKTQITSQNIGDLVESSNNNLNQGADLEKSGERYDPMAQQINKAEKEYMG